MYTIYVGIGLALIFALGRALHNAYFHPLAHLPGPKLWGGTRMIFVWYLFRGVLHKKVKELHDRYGFVVRIAPDEVSFIDGRAWDTLYTGQRRNKGLKKNAIVFGAQEFRSILDESDEGHTAMRKVMANSFSTQMIKRQEPLLQKYTGRLIDQLRKYAHSRQAINIVEWVNFLTFDMTGELAFSESFDQVREQRYHPWVQLVVSHLRYSALSICLRYFGHARVIMPLITPPSLHRLKWKFVSLASDKINRRIARGRNVQLDDMVGACLSSDGGPDLLTQEQLIGTFSFLIVAGSETTSTVLAGSANYLCRYPKVYDRLRSEIRQLSESDLTLTNLTKLTYLTAVIKESMRMCYPIPSALTRIVPSGGLNICGYYLPAETIVGIPQFAAHYSAQHFDNPYEFRPERWLTEGTAQDSDLAIFRPFAIGGRSCIGQGLAWAEMRLVLARLVWAFNFEASDMPDWPDQKSYMLWHKDCCHIRLQNANGKWSSES